MIDMIVIVSIILGVLGHGNLGDGIPKMPISTLGDGEHLFLSSQGEVVHFRKNDKRSVGVYVHPKSNVLTCFLGRIENRNIVGKYLDIPSGALMIPKPIFKSVGTINISFKELVRVKNVHESTVLALYKAMSETTLQCSSALRNIKGL